MSSLLGKDHNDPSDDGFFDSPITRRDVAMSENSKSVFVLAYAFVSFSGFLMGLLCGWIFWA